MKTLLLTLTMMLTMGTANAFGLTVLVSTLATASTTLAVAEGARVSSNDPRLFKTVTASHAGENGYWFDITQFEYDQNPSKYTLR